jgi:hypothetical protein
MKNRKLWHLSIAALWVSSCRSRTRMTRRRLRRHRRPQEQTQDAGQWCDGVRGNRAAAVSMLFISSNIDNPVSGVAGSGPSLEPEARGSGDGSRKTIRCRLLRGVPDWHTLFL